MGIRTHAQSQRSDAKDSVSVPLPMQTRPFGAPISTHLSSRESEPSADLLAAFDQTNRVGYRFVPSLSDISSVPAEARGIQPKLAIGAPGNQYEQETAEAEELPMLFYQGTYEAASQESPALLAHELTHRVQQNGATGKILRVQRKVGVEYETGVRAFDKRKADQKMTDSKNTAKPFPDILTMTIKDTDFKAVVEEYTNHCYVNQDETMYRHDEGWQIDSDNSKLEFVTEPAVPITELAQPLASLVNNAARLNTEIQVATPIDNVFQGGNKTNDYYIIPYKNNELILKKVTGNPQATIGIPFDRIYEFFNFLASYDMQMSKALQQEQAEDIEKCINNVKIKLQNWQGDTTAKEQFKQAASQKIVGGKKKLEKQESKGFLAMSQATSNQFKTITKIVDDLTGKAPGFEDLDNQQKNKLKGILHLISQYSFAATSEQQFSYKKQAFTLLSRTSFSAMYEALEQAAKDLFPDLATNLVRGLGCETKQVFPVMQQDNPFTIHDWIKSIVKPQKQQIKKDIYFTEKGYDTEKIKQDFGSVEGEPNWEAYENYQKSLFVNADLMTAPGAFDQRGSETDKSMGAFTELDSDQHAQELVVFELRQIFHFTELDTFTPQTLLAFLQDLKAFEKYIM